MRSSNQPFYTWLYRFWVNSLRDSFRSLDTRRLHTTARQDERYLHTATARRWLPNPPSRKFTRVWYWMHLNRRPVFSRFTSTANQCFQFSALLFHGRGSNSDHLTDVLACAMTAKIHDTVGFSLLQGMSPTWGNAPSSFLGCGTTTLKIESVDWLLRRKRGFAA